MGRFLHPPYWDILSAKSFGLFLKKNFISKGVTDTTIASLVTDNGNMRNYIYMHLGKKKNDTEQREKPMKLNRNAAERFCISPRD